MQFTGKQRDSGSNLDYFWARHYSSTLGRWMSPDPSGIALADLGNPQLSISTAMWRTIH